MADSKNSYYQDIVNGIRRYYNEYTGDANKYAVAKLLLIDNRPVVKWLDGVPHYAYIVVSDPGFMVVYKKRSARRIDKYGQNLEHRFEAGSLERFLKKYESQYHLQEWASIEGVLYNSSALLPNAVRFDCKLKDLDAISLHTDEYIWIRRIATEDSYAGTHQVYGMDFPQSIPSKFIGNASFARWVNYMYMNYMLNANLELLEYYVRNYKRVRVFNEHSTVYHFTEFVPCMVRFGEIDNPVMQPEMVKWMQRQFPDWMKEMLAYSQVPSVNGSISISDVNDTVAAYYTNRAAVEIITKVSAAPDAGRMNVNVYSPRYLMGNVYAAIWGPMGVDGLDGLPPMFYSNRIKWHRLVKDDAIMGFYAEDKEVPKGYAVSDVEYPEMLFMEMLATVYGINKASLIDRLMPARRTVGIDDIRKAGILKNG